MKFIIESVKRYDERGTQRDGWRLLVKSKLADAKTDSIFQNLNQLFKHLNTHANTYEEVAQFEAKSELSQKSKGLITQGSLRFKEPSI